jgi:transposase
LRPEGIARKHTQFPTQALNAIGIDDWTLRRDHRYGTLVCDLERRRIVKLLPDRETATVAARLTGHLAIEVVSRDRGGGYGEAVARPNHRPFKSLIVGILWRTPVLSYWILCANPCGQSKLQ